MKRDKDGAEFYIADPKGIPVWNKDKIQIDTKSGEVEECKWTLGEYLDLTNECVKGNVLLMSYSILCFAFFVA